LGINFGPHRKNWIRLARERPIWWAERQVAKNPHARGMGRNP